MTDPHYGCHNRGPRAQTQQVQDGWTPDGRRVMRTIDTRLDDACHYLDDEVDKRCAGCKHAAGLFTATSAEAAA